MMIMMSATLSLGANAISSLIFSVHSYQYSNSISNNRLLAMVETVVATMKALWISIYEHCGVLFASNNVLR
ncbi:hypothetical protein L484_026382 [Morus notabilis]|uniref:Secreted protein n=1 Tax=Morus notabilis TaxID=981085 RepID=W9QXY3_9ROSA|nr:hypothetical protein L484_026382 [Morus notabilis]